MIEIYNINKQPIYTHHYKNFEGADLKDQDLPGADFRGENLELAIFKGANLESANFTGANLAGVDFRDADLSFAQLDNTNLECALLARANLSHANLFGADISGSILWSTKFNNADFINTRREQWHIYRRPIQVNLGNDILIWDEHMEISFRASKIALSFSEWKSFESNEKFTEIELVNQAWWGKNKSILLDICEDRNRDH